VQDIDIESRNKVKRSCESPLENHIHYIDQKIRHLLGIQFDEVASRKVLDAVLDNSSGLAYFLVDEDRHEKADR
jgi:hypothetical protein